jgi:hypothetical protein
MQFLDGGGETVRIFPFAITEVPGNNPVFYAKVVGMSHFLPLLRLRMRGTSTYSTQHSAAFTYTDNFIITLKMKQKQCWQSE